MSRVIFYFKGLLCVLWFFACTAITIPVSLLRWRHPSNSYFFAVIWTRVALKILGIEIKIINEDRLKSNQPCVYLANHQSNMDIIVQAYSYRPNTVIIGKRELIYIPLFGLLFYLTGNILLNRKNRQTAVASFDEVEDYIKNKKISVFIFPEGTRNHGAKKMLPLKRGAFYMAIRAQVPLVPIVASPIYDVVNTKKKFIRKGVIFLNVLDPISTIGKSDSDVDTILNFAQEKMQKAYDESKTQVTT